MKVEAPMDEEAELPIEIQNQLSDDYFVNGSQMPNSRILTTRTISGWCVVSMIKNR